MTVSDTRTEADDRSGDTLAARITDAGHTVAERAIVKDDQATIIAQRSEEHTSELQSHVRISYAVFCLKKKKTKTKKIQSIKQINSTTASRYMYQRYDGRRTMG